MGRAAAAGEGPPGWSAVEWLGCSAPDVCETPYVCHMQRTCSNYNNIITVTILNMHAAAAVIVGSHDASSVCLCLGPRLRHRLGSRPLEVASGGRCIIVDDYAWSLEVLAYLKSDPAYTAPKACIRTSRRTRPHPRIIKMKRLLL